MIGRYAVAAARIRQELSEIERLVERVERAIRAGRESTTDRDLFFDSAALNLHDSYSGLERIFTHVASSVDASVPTGPDWHRELLRQMATDLPGIRPRVITEANAHDIDEYLRFRHVVRHTYAIELDPERIERLANRLRPVFREVSQSLDAFATLLEGLAREA